MTIHIWGWLKKPWIALPIVGVVATTALTIQVFHGGSGASPTKLGLTKQEHGVPGAVSIRLLLGPR